LSALVRASRSSRSEQSRWLYLLAGIGVATLLGFLLLPGSIAAKTHLALHGICAQRPSHSLHFGNMALPLDARMTGIYVGAVASAVWFVASGKIRNTRMPPRRVITTLALFVALLAGDGFNALAADLARPHPYVPSNGLRLLTGVLGGIALGVALVHLLAVTMWVQGNRSLSVVPGVAALVPPLGIGLTFGALAISGLPILYAPFAIGVSVAAVGVFAVLSTIALALVSNRAWTFSSMREMAALACGGLVAAMGVIAALAGARLLLEMWLELPQLT
jgi:uncharacterized membrane protein